MRLFSIGEYFGFIHIELTNNIFIHISNFSSHRVEGECVFRKEVTAIIVAQIGCRFELQISDSGLPYIEEILQLQRQNTTLSRQGHPVSPKKIMGYPSSAGYYCGSLWKKQRFWSPPLLQICLPPTSIMFGICTKRSRGLTPAPETIKDSTRWHLHKRHPSY